MPGSIDPNMVALLNADPSVFRFCRLWEIRRTDTQKFYFTENNVVTKFQGQNFVPAGSVETSAIQLREGYESSNTELRGIVTSDKITEDDLRGGKFRDATVTEYLIDWASPGSGYYEKRTFLILSINFSTEYWNAEMVEKSKFLEKPHGRIYTRNCQWTFCDPDTCGQDEGTHTTTTTVSGTPSSRSVFNAAAGLTTDDFRYGKCTFGANSGKLQGLALEIIKNQGSEVTLALPTPYDIPANATVALLKGCAKNQTACKNTYNNFANFGGFPFIPGDDAIRVNPDQPAP